MSRLDPAGTAAALRVAIVRLARSLRASTPGGLTASQWSALSTIETHQPVRIGDIADREGVSAPTATRLVASLESAGLVGREVDPGDRRSVQVSLTAAGHAKLEWARTVRTATLTQRLERLPADEVAHLAAAVPILERLASDLDPTPPTPPISPRST